VQVVLDDEDVWAWAFEPFELHEGAAHPAVQLHRVRV
jgi:hypothetical protein